MGKKEAGHSGRGISEFWQSLYGLVSFIREAFLKSSYPKKKVGSKDLIFLLQFIKPVWKLALATAILTIVIAGLKSLLPLNTKFFVDFAVMKQSTAWVSNLLTAVHIGFVSPYVDIIVGSVGGIILFMLVLTLTYGVLEIVQGYLGARYQQEMVYGIQVKLFDHVLRFPISFFKNSQTGYLLSRISADVDSIPMLYSIVIAMGLENLMYIVFTFIILFTLNAKLALITLCIAPVYLVINAFFGERIRSISHRERESNAQVSKEIQEVLSGVEMVKSHATEEKEVKKVSDRIKDVVNARVINTLLMTSAQFFIRGAQFFFTILVMWFGYQEISAGTMSIGDYIAFSTYVAILSGSLNSIFSAYLAFQRILASADRIMELFNTVSEDDRGVSGKRSIIPEKVIGEIKYDKVSFSYDKDVPVLNGISFNIPPGGSISIVGPSGVGKTTMVNLLLKFYEPQSGAISLDGTDLAEINRKWLREQVGIVSQDTFLFNDTVENNIKYGMPDATKEEVIDAAKRAKIDRDISKFPKGYDTVIGEKGIRISVGQRQRLSIARAFLRNTPILILDEPTSSIDTETENEIKESLRELMKGRTTIIISHRMSFANLSDTILVIDDGKLSQSGTHQELISTDGLYSKLYNTGVA